MDSTIIGLTHQEVVERRAKGLGNTYQIQSSRTYFQIIRENVFTFINNVLFGLGIALVLLGRVSDALISVVVILVNTIVSVVQEIRAKRTLDRIALLTRPTAFVIREGHEQQIDPKEIVVDDILVIRPGDQIVVDGVVVGDGKIEADESLLTGESDHIPKQIGDKVFSGSFCVTGTTMFKAEKVGKDAVAAQFTAGARAFRRVMTPLQSEINVVIRVILLVAIYFELLLAVNAFLKSIPLVENVKMSVVIVGLVPNGLFLAIAVAYALGAVRIAGKGALVQQSNAIESLSNVDTLCLDKTGTLTANRIQFHDLAAFNRTPEELKAILGDFSASASAPNKTSDAIAAACTGLKRTVFSEVPFSSDRKWSALALNDPQRRGTFVLGAPEMILPNLKSGSDLGGKAAEWADLGLRVVLFAGLPDPVELNIDGKPALPGNLEPFGLVSFSDELRPEAKATLEGFRSAGVKLKIISGDNPSTVAALAQQAGLGPDLKLISGLEINDLDDSQLAQVAEQCTIFGRITPQQKERIVGALTSRGHYVAMIGDGVNDVLSLKKSQLGIAMQSGSQAARAVADIILMGDSFGSLPYALKEGQRIINGMQDILKLFLVRVLYAAMLIISTFVIGGFPFAPKHNSILTLLTVGVPTLFLAAWARPGMVEKGNLMRKLMHFIIPPMLTLSLFGTVVYLAYLSPTYRSILHSAPDALSILVSHPVLRLAQTALTIFTILCGLLLLIFVEPPIGFFTGGDKLSGDRRPTYLAIISLMVFMVILSVAPIREFFDLAPIPPLEFLILAAAALVWGALIRWIWRSHVMDRFLSMDFNPTDTID